MQSKDNRAQSTAKKTVQFGADIQCQVHEVECHRDVTEIWWTQQEIADIERESETILYFMNNTTGTSCSTHVDLSFHSIRGLEKKTEIGAWEAYEIQRDARNVVLCQQDKHRKCLRRPIAPIFDRNSSLDSGMQDAFDVQEAIAKLYQAASLKARRAAYEVGLRDFIEAKRDDNQRHDPQPPVPVVPVEKCNKVIPITSEPMVPKWGRKISMPLMDPSENSESLIESTITKEVKPVITSRNYRSGAAPKVRSSLSPLKKRRSKSDSAERSERSRETQADPNKPKRSASLQRKVSSDKDVDPNKPKRSASLQRKVSSDKDVDSNKPKRSASLHRKVSSDKDVDSNKPKRSASLHRKVSSDKDVDSNKPKRSASLHRKVSSDKDVDSNRATRSASLPRNVFTETAAAEVAPKQKASTISLAESVTVTPTFSDSQPQRQINTALLGDIFKELSRKKGKKLDQSNQFDMKIIKKLETRKNDGVGENHRLVMIAKKKRHPSEESTSRNGPQRSISHDSQGNHTAATAGMLDNSSSSIESVGFEHNISDHEGATSTILSTLLKRMGGARKKKLKNKSKCEEV